MARNGPFQGGNAWKVDGCVLGSLHYMRGHCVTENSVRTPRVTLLIGAMAQVRFIPSGCNVQGGAPLAGNEGDTVVPAGNQCTVNHGHTLSPLTIDLNGEEVPSLSEKLIKVIHTAPLTP